jgi:CheY-specific phosphatase CheX
MTMPDQAPTTVKEFNQEWTPMLETAAREVFQMILGPELQKANPDTLEGTEFTAMVGLARQICGALSVRCSQDAANQAAALMLGLPLDKAAENAWDAISEVANMIAVNFKNKLDGISDRCMLSVPTVITGGDYSFWGALRHDSHGVVFPVSRPAHVGDLGTAQLAFTRIGPNPQLINPF